MVNKFIKHLCDGKALILSLTQYSDKELAVIITLIKNKIIELSKMTKSEIYSMPGNIPIIYNPMLKIILKNDTLILNTLWTDNDNDLLNIKGKKIITLPQLLSLNPKDFKQYELRRLLTREN